MPGKFLGLIFDFNGVLLWDDALQRDSWRVFATRLRPQPLSDLEIDIHVHGRNGQHTLEYLLGRAITIEQAAELMEQKEQIYRQMCLNLNGDFELSPGAIPLLETLLRHNIPRTIATASGRNNVDFFIQHLSLANWFDLAQIVYNDGKIAGKPAPDLYLKAAQVLGLCPADCVVVEDSVSGLQAAHAAGVGWVIALGPLATHPQLAARPGVDQVIENLGELVCADLFAQAAI